MKTVSTLFVLLVLAIGASAQSKPTDDCFRLIETRSGCSPMTEGEKKDFDTLIHAKSMVVEYHVSCLMMSKVDREAFLDEDSAVLKKTADDVLAKNKNHPTILSEDTDEHIDLIVEISSNRIDKTGMPLELARGTTAGRTIYINVYDATDNRLVYMQSRNVVLFQNDVRMVLTDFLGFWALFNGGYLN